MLEEGKGKESRGMHSLPLSVMRCDMMLRDGRYH